MLLCFPGTVDDFRHALTDAAVHVHLGVFADFLDRLHLQLQGGLIGRDLAGGHLLKQFIQFHFIHDDSPVCSVGKLLEEV